MRSLSLSSCDSNKDNTGIIGITNRSQLNNIINDIPLINTPNDYGWTPLYRAIISGNLQATEDLLKQGADPNQVNQMGETPLYQAVEMGLIDHTQLLLRFNADPNITKSDGMSPLLCAVKKSSIPLITVLLENKAQPNMQNRLYKQTALHIALKSNMSFDIIRLLIENKCSLIIKDKYHKTPLDYADLNNETLMNYLNEMIYQNHSDSASLSPSPNNKSYLTPLSSATSRYNKVKKASTSNFSIMSSKEDNSTNTYHENNMFTLENGIASFYTSKSKKKSSNKDIISDISPLEILVTNSNNSHIFSELQELTNRGNTDSNRTELANEGYFLSSLKNNQQYNSSMIVNPIIKKNEMSIDMEMEKYTNCNTNTPISIKERIKTNNNRTNSVKISYHRSNSNSNSNNNNSFHSNKENNVNCNNIPRDQSSELYYLSNDKPINNSNSNSNSNIDINSNILFNRNTNHHSMNSTRMQTVTNPMGINTYKEYHHNKMATILSDYTSKQIDDDTNRTYHKYTFTQVKQLHDWLTSIDLLCYFNTFINKGLYEIEPLIQQMKSGEINLTFRDIEDLGIKKPGHIFRFILKAQCDAGQYESKLIDYLFKDSLYGNDMHLLRGNDSSEDIESDKDDLLKLSKDSTLCKCWDNLIGNKNEEYNLSSWLNANKLSHLQDNFTHNGFDILEYVYLQLFSSKTFTEDNIIDYLHVYKQNDRKRLLKALLTDKKRISDVCGIEYNDDDVKSYDLNVSNCQLCLIF